MQTATELYTATGLRAATLTGDASITLVENWEEQFGVLLAGGCRQQSFGPNLHLDDVFWFRAERRAFDFFRFREVTLSNLGHGFAAIDRNTGCCFPNLSEVPYKTIFLAGDEYRRLIQGLAFGKGRAVFQCAQHHLRKLPGFRAVENRLTTPENYAMVFDDPGLQMLAG